ncbi:hypothetical protein QFC22_002102 [Naganishia vaughanmartiniae]|uniref:Uncharacterized protein n=1 Tax=Naganishia vaughanmartiniae TaxID=1424756 RepID=A0ACC2XDN0_9TREE|nr:hypothetical protein QFC22_002102 [Naganishia vaughanmartiniae]
MAKSKVITKKQQKKQHQSGSSSRRKETTQDQSYTVPQLIEQAHNLLAQQHFQEAIRKLDQALVQEPANREARELVGIAECEEGDVEKGRAHLQQLISQPAAAAPQPSAAPISASPYLYLAQTALSPQEALQHYESALQVLQRRLEGMTVVSGVGGGDDGMSGAAEEEETEQEVKKECVMAFVAMVEIWMSDLCFEPEAPTQCNTLIHRALQISPNDPDALLTLASIRMSESNPAEAREIVIRVADAVLRVAERLEMKADELEKVQAQLQAQVDADAEFTLQEGEETLDLELPPMQTRYLLTRLLLEHSDFGRALKMVDTIRGEDDEDVEGCYLEGWGWYCRGKALEDGVVSEDKDGEGGVTVEECYMEALGSLMECQSLHAQQNHPDEGILAHVNELVAELEGKGIKVDVGDDDDEDAEEGDVEMS